MHQNGLKEKAIGQYAIHPTSPILRWLPGLIKNDCPLSPTENGEWEGNNAGFSKAHRRFAVALPTRRSLPGMITWLD